MAASVKSNKAELEQVALAMMMMAGGEGASASSSSPAKDEVGVRTRATRSSTGKGAAGSTPTTPPSLPNLRRRSSTQIQKRPEPVSGNCLNRNKNRKNPDQSLMKTTMSMPPMSLKSETEKELVDDDNDGHPNGLELDQSNEIEMEFSATDLVKYEEALPEAEEEDDESIVCSINPMIMIGPDDDQDQDPPESPMGSHQSTNSGSGGGGSNQTAGGTPYQDDGIYMSSSRRFFRPEFKEKVLRAFQTDPECVGNQRATARKFGIHRRQVQKWIQQFSAGVSVKVENSQVVGEQNQEEKDESHLDSIELTSIKQEPVSRRKKVLTRSSLGNNLPNQNRSSAGGSGRASDPPPRLLRLAGRSRGKSMPLKGGSNKSTFVPTIIHPSSPISLNLTKASLKQNGRTKASSTATYGYFNENGNGSGGGGTSSNGNMFMNMSTLLASAAAAGNLGMPLSLDNPRNFSPRDHSPLGNNGRGSPAHSAGGSSGSGNSSLQNALLLVDELNYLYPNSDFSLLRKALLKEEVSLEKLAHPLIRSKFAEFRVNGNGLSSDVSQGLRDLRRAAATVSPTPGKSTSTSQEYNTQQTIDIIRQQQQYLKWLGQTCGMTNTSDLSGLNLADINTNGGGVPSWFNPFAAAAAAGLPIASTSGNGRFGGVNGNEGNGRRKENSDNHRFASPRVPPAVNSGKAKTVAAALAATRVQSTNSQQQLKNYSMNQLDRGGRQSQNSRQAAQRRKPKPRPRNTSLGDEDIDPTSMLEVVTSIPSPSISPRKNQYNYNGHHHRNNGSGNADYNQHGMDLTTTTASANTTTTTSTTTRLISKAMNKEYSFFDVLGLVRKNPEETESSSNGNGNGSGLTHTASLENFVQNILPSSSERERSPPNAQAASSTSSSSPPASDLSDSDKTKNMVIEAFSLDPEISGDPRAVARKFGLNVRVVMKWLKEGPVKASPLSNEGYHENGTSDNNNLPRMNGGGDEDDKEYLRNHKGMLNESNNNSPGSGATGVNKRKNSKPNQICDFPTDDEAGLNGALDMVVPIKKRRVSSPSPAPQDA